MKYIRIEDQVDLLEVLKLGAVVPRPDSESTNVLALLLRAAPPTAEVEVPAPLVDALVSVILVGELVVVTIVTRATRSDRSFIYEAAASISDASTRSRGRPADRRRTDPLLG